MNVFIQSLGCDKNLSDTEHMMGLLAKEGYSFTQDEAEADIILVNTCCFIGDAKQESIDEIIRLGAFKNEGKCKALIVSGCLSERYRKEFFEALPEVDGIIGISAWNRISECVSEALSGHRPEIFDKKNALCSSKERLVTTGGHYAYLKIAEGCNKCCTYCAIPRIRGPYRSLPMEELLEEARTLAEQGVRELILVAQETTLYGVDLYGEKKLTELVENISRIEGIRWIRLLYCYPEEITDDMIRMISENPKVCKYIDMPIQHASDTVLSRMNRKTTQKEITERIKTIRKTIPNITLRTTMITGFPGETDEEFDELYRFVKRMKFDRLGVFTYSREEGTKAAKMRPQVLKKVKVARRDEIMATQQAISLAHGKKCVGKVFECMIEGALSGEQNVYIGRTEMDAPSVDSFVFIKSEKELMSGDFVSVKITGYSEYDLEGELYHESAK